MKVFYTVGRAIPEARDAFDLEGCDQFDSLPQAVFDLIERTACTIEGGGSGNAGHLTLLRCVGDEDGSVETYQPVGDGDIVEAMMNAGILKAP